MTISNLNYFAVLVSGLAGFAVGAVWYAPFTFGPLWLRYNPAIMDELESGGRARAYGFALIGSLVQALVLALFLVLAGGPGLGETIWIGFLLWLGFTAAPSLVDALFSRRPMGGWAVDIGHRLVVTVAMAFILGVWP